MKPFLQEQACYENELEMFVYSIGDRSQRGAIQGFFLVSHKCNSVVYRFTCLLK